MHCSGHWTETVTHCRPYQFMHLWELRILIIMNRTQRLEHLKIWFSPFCIFHWMGPHISMAANEQQQRVYTPHTVCLYEIDPIRFDAIPFQNIYICVCNAWSVHSPLINASLYGALCFISMAYKQIENLKWLLWYRLGSAAFALFDLCIVCEYPIPFWGSKWCVWNERREADFSQPLTNVAALQ